EQEADWLRSPIFAMLERGQTFGRWRLDSPGPETDYPILHALRAEGGTEYAVQIVGFAPGTALRGIAISFCTQARAGFSQADLAAVAAVMPTFALAVAKLGLGHTLREVTATYLGRSTAERVLDGQIQRGQGRAVPAAI